MNDKSVRNLKFVSCVIRDVYLVCSVLKIRLHGWSGRDAQKDYSADGHSAFLYCEFISVFEGAITEHISDCPQFGF